MDYVHPTHRNIVVGAGYSGSGFKVRSCSIDQYHLTTLIVYDRPFVQVYRSSLRFSHSRAFLCRHQCSSIHDGYGWYVEYMFPVAHIFMIQSSYKLYYITYKDVLSALQSRLLTVL